MHINNKDVLFNKVKFTSKNWSSCMLFVPFLNLMSVLSNAHCRLRENLTSDFVGEMSILVINGRCPGRASPLLPLAHCVQ